MIKTACDGIENSMIAINNNLTYILDKILTVTLSIFALLNKINYISEQQWCFE